MTMTGGLRKGWQASRHNMAGARVGGPGRSYKSADKSGKKLNNEGRR